MSDALDLDEQLCFALYTASRVTQSAYRHALDQMDLTYPQWLVLLALWEADGSGVKELGERLRLDSGTLSPLLRRLETRGVIERRRDGEDSRRVTIHLTPAGWQLRERAGEVQRCLVDMAQMTPDELTTLRDLARRLVATSTTEGRNR